MVLVTTKIIRKKPKRVSAPGLEIFKRELAKPNAMTKDRSGRKNQDTKIPRTRSPGQGLKKKKRGRK